MAMNLPPRKVCLRIRELFLLLALPDAKKFARNLAKLIELLTAHELTWNDVPELLAATDTQARNASPAALKARAANKAAWKIRHHIYRLFGQLSASANVAYAHEQLIEYLTKHGLVWTDLPAILAEPDAKAWAPPQAVPSPAMRPDGTQVNVLDLTLRLLELHLAQTEHQRMATALWALHTHVFGRFRYTPRLVVLSPVRRCGKSRLMRLLEQLTTDAFRSDNVTAAVLYHEMARRERPFLLDEGDNLGLFNNDVLCAIFNAGYERGGIIHRVIGGRSVRFPVYAPLAVAAIGTLPLPLMDRAIIINMQRKANVVLQSFDEYNPVFPTTRAEIQKWAANCVLDRNPEIPPGLNKNDRAVEIWSVLLSIADNLGHGEAARAAAIALNADRQDEDPKITLLIDIRDERDAVGGDCIFSKTLVEKLHAIEDGLWSEWRGLNDDRQPRALTQAELGHLLREYFKIKSRTVRIGADTRRGYRWSQFETTWEAYCPASDTATQPSKIIRLVGKGSDTRGDT
jgi:Protein of unknown function (DUF3631)